MGEWFSLRRLSATVRRSGQPKKPEKDTGHQPVPSLQNVLLLREPKQDYQLVHDYPVPTLLRGDEVLVKTKAIGLNPIDWKAPDYNFGIPEFPYISGRELSGTVAQTSSSPSEWRLGDRVVAISTDYRDIRKGAYQQYVISLDHTLVRLPRAVSYEEGSTLGVAFVASAVALGVSIGVDFSPILDGPNLFETVRSIETTELPVDIRAECLEGVQNHERPRPGDWMAIWGGSATSANLVIQLAKLAGLKVAVVVDVAKHGVRLSSHRAIRPDLLVDSHDPKRAVNILRANTGGRLRFGLDTRGRETATFLLEALSAGDPPAKTVGEQVLPPSPPDTPDANASARAHLIGLTGLPKGLAPEGIRFHTVPIKLFHEVKQVGKPLATWLGRLLEKKLILPADIIDVEDGLERVNAGLHRMRRGEISGGKLVVRV